MTVTPLLRFYRNGFSECCIWGMASPREISCSLKQAYVFVNAIILQPVLWHQLAAMLAQIAVDGPLMIVRLMTFLKESPRNNHQSIHEFVQFPYTMHDKLNTATTVRPWSSSWHHGNIWFKESNTEMQLWNDVNPHNAFLCAENLATHHELHAMHALLLCTTQSIMAKTNLLKKSACACATCTSTM